ncbi:MAG: patatin-like protein [Opitutaceae bacterium]|nr:patatin-like protein [Opitutaceae bacterium]
MTAIVSPSTRPVREVRFAVVMYGGVSLAIYIHGVARELWHLVRATARHPDGSPVVPPDRLTGSERVYRMLSHALPECEGDAARTHDVASLAGRAADAGPVRFVIDLISGTSAGGINGVFLAKALATNQDITPLRDLWLEDGDIATLLNDAESLRDMPGLDLATPRNSLLNSGRMYRLLLKALRSMRETDGISAGENSRFVEQLDLFVTATDIRGLVLPIELADKQVDERRHRQVFQFVYAARDENLPRSDANTPPSGRNDFVPGNTPFLAFAARCTSSFPFAFEPMQLADIDTHLEGKPTAGDRDYWAKYFHRDYAGDKEQLDFATRSFGDGGYLDNKPFGHVTEALRIRRAEVPVDRKLLYVEPSPDHPVEEGLKLRAGRPDALENVLAAAVSLPAKETIRDDIERLSRRNGVIERMRRITEHIEGDLIADADAPGRPGISCLAARAARVPPPLETWLAQDLADLIREHGMSFVAYHRLKIADTTDDLAEIVSGLVDAPVGSKAFHALQLLIAAWRDARYAKYTDRSAPKDAPRPPTQNQFLLDFNFRYRFRRLLFVRDRLDQLARMDERAEQVMRCGGEAVRFAEVAREPHRAVVDRLRAEVNRLYCGLRHERRVLRRGVADRAVAAIKTLQMGPRDLEPIVDAPDTAGRLAHAQAFLEKHRPVVNQVMGLLAERINKVFRHSSTACVAALRPEGQAPGSPEDLHAWRLHRVAWFYFENFEDYDQYLYPLMYGADAEENDPVEILRVSPEDATRLIAERPDESAGSRRRKLGGTFLANFGGFLDPLWRRNDMLWGRLDAVERVVLALLPHDVDRPLRERLVAEAQAEIVHEETRDLPVEQARRILVEGLMRTSTGKPDVEALARLRTALVDAAPPGATRTRLEALMETDALRTCYEHAFAHDRRPVPDAALKSAGRAAAVAGSVLEGLSERRPALKHPAGWLTRAGRICVALVELAMPRSFGSILARHWSTLLLLCALIVLVAGVALNRGEFVAFGLILAAVTLTVRSVLAFLNRLFLRGWGESGRLLRVMRKTARVLVAILLLAALTLAIVGGFYAREAGAAARDWISRTVRSAESAPPPPTEGTAPAPH